MTDLFLAALHKRHADLSATIERCREPGRRASLQRALRRLTQEILEYENEIRRAA